MRCVLQLALFLVLGRAQVAAQESGGLALHFLKDEAIDLRGALEHKLENLQLADAPWIAQAEIEFYDASAQSLYLKKKPPTPGKIPMRGKPFVFVVNGQPKLVGALWSMASSILPESGVPIVQSIGTPDRIVEFSSVTIQSAGNEKVVKPDALRTAISAGLKGTGLFHEGIALSLDAIEVTAGEKTVSYTFTIKNNDTEILLVLDPERAGHTRFHYFCNGPALMRLSKEQTAYRADTNAMFDPNHPPVQPREFDLKWLTVLKPGDDMKRTVKLDAYPVIPAGTYNSLLEFRSPLHVPADQMKQPGGRVWYGGVRAEKIVQIGKLDQPEF